MNEETENVTLLLCQKDGKKEERGIRQSHILLQSKVEQVSMDETERVFFEEERRSKTTFLSCHHFIGKRPSIRKQNGSIITTKKRNIARG